MVRPVDSKFPLTQAFGANPHFSWQLGYGHLGEDFGCPIGTDVYAIQNGRVLFADWGIKMSQSFAAQYAFIFGSPDSGIVTVIEYDDGTVGIAAHLDSTHLNAGNRVTTGQVTGKTGTTGRSTGPHLHQECMRLNLMNNGKYGRINPSSYWPNYTMAKPLAANERLVGPSVVNQRAEPNTAVTTKIVRKIPANSREVFTGYVIGEMVNSGGIKSNIWYKDKLGYAWAGLFTTQSTAGLTNLTPAPAPSTLRTTIATAVTKARTSPYLLDNNIKQEIKVSSLIDCDGYTDQGDEFQGSKVWFRTRASKLWMHSKLFTSQSTAGLPKVTPPARPAAPKPPVVTAPVPSVPAPEPTPAKYAFEKSVACVTEVLPAATNKFQYGNTEPQPPVGIVVHQFNAATKDENPTTNHETVHIGSLINTFTVENDRVASAHFGVEGTRIIQFVDLKDRAYHAGSEGNHLWSIEVYGGMDAVTLASLATLIKQLEELKGGKLSLYRHNEFNNTACGKHVDLDKIKSLVHPELVGTPAPAVTEASVLSEFFSWLTNMFLNRKK